MYTDRKRRMLVISIDQSTGATSAVGVALLLPDKTILSTASLRPKKKYQVVEKRLVCLHEQLTQFLSPYFRVALEAKTNIKVVFEKTVMKGKQGESLAESVGAFVAVFPNSELVTFHKVHNKQMKKAISGSGAGDKVAVAKGLLHHLPTSEHETITKLLNGQKYDELDAIALGVTHMQERNG